MIGVVLSYCLLIATLNESASNRSQPKEPENDVLCGAECLYIILNAQKQVSEPFKTFLKRMGEPTPTGYTMNALKSVAESCGSSTTVTTLTEIQLLGLPDGCHAIIHRKPAHFQVVTKANSDFLLVMDSKLGQSQVPRHDVAENYSDQCLLIADAPEKLKPRSQGYLWMIGAAFLIVSLLLTVVGILRYRMAMLLVMICFISGCSDSNRSPRIVCQKPFTDLGEIEVGKPHKIEFVIANESKVPLRITDTASSCGCTSTSLANSIVDPWSKTILTATITPSKNGKSHSSIQVFSNDKRQPAIQLQARWTIASPVTFSIPQIETTLSKLHEVDSFEFRVNNNTKKSFQIVSVAHEPETPVRIELKQMEAMKWNAQIILDELKEGAYTGRIVAKTDQEDELGEFVWRVVVLAPIRIYPETVLVEANDKAVGEDRKIEFLVEQSIEGEIEIVDGRGAPLPFHKRVMDHESAQITVLQKNLPEDHLVQLRIGSYSVPLSIKTVP